MTERQQELINDLITVEKQIKKNIKTFDESTKSEKVGIEEQAHLLKKTVDLFVKKDHLSSELNKELAQSMMRTINSVEEKGNALQKELKEKWRVKYE